MKRIGAEFLATVCCSNVLHERRRHGHPRIAPDGRTLAVDVARRRIRIIAHFTAQLGLISENVVDDAHDASACSGEAAEKGGGQMVSGEMAEAARKKQQRESKDFDHRLLLQFLMLKMR